MEDVGAQVVPPIFIHQTLTSRYTDVPSIAKKRALSYQVPNFHQHNHLHQHHLQQQGQLHAHTWNPKAWDWDSTRFLTKQSSDTVSSDLKRKDDLPAGIPSTLKKKTVEVLDEEDESLRLNLGGGLNLNYVEEPVSKPPKKVRPGSPAGGTYPMCQVDNCKEDLSNAKDYHRRHKVCELHSKSSKALVAKLMQRFCQQCSRLIFLPIISYLFVVTIPACICLPFSFASSFDAPEIQY